jgi:hypothetical protein
MLVTLAQRTTVQNSSAIPAAAEIAIGAVGLALLAFATLRIPDAAGRLLPTAR